LDAGYDTVKLLQLRSARGEVSVQACAKWRVPPLLRDDATARRDATIEAVKTMLRSNPFRGRRAVTALKCSELGIKNIRLPKMLEGELAGAVQWEAAERFSFEVAPDRVKFLKAGEVRQGNETQDEIIVMAATRETVERHLETLDRVGLIPTTIGAEPVELFRAFERRLRRRADQDSVNVLLDIGSGSTRVIVARGRQIVFVKSIDIAGKNLTGSAAKQLNLTTQEAEDLRSLVMKEYAATDAAAHESNAGGRPAVPESVRWTIHDAIRGELESLAREIALCLRYCSVTFRGIRPENVIVTGGQAYDPSVLTLLSEQLGVDCQLGRPLWGVDLSGAPAELDRRGALPEWTLCAGLAMKEAGCKDIGDELGAGQHRLSA
jgi:type IV pilus assembly protein PilM